MFFLILAVILLIAAYIFTGSMVKEDKNIQRKIDEYVKANEEDSAKARNAETSIRDKEWLASNVETRKRKIKDLEENRKTYPVKPIRIGASVVAIILIILSMVTLIPTGYTGIKTTFGKVEDSTLSSGINFKLPWQNVINMDNREQRSAFTMQAFSKDIQQVEVQGSINLNIDKTTAMNLYKDVGVNYMDVLVQPRVLEDVKIIIAKYQAESLIENRQKCSDSIYDLLKQELAEKGINVISFAIENIDFTDAFEAAVEAKQVATQEKLKAQTEQERQTMEMQQKAERDRIQAQAAADVQKIDADAKAYAVKVEAEAQAEANEKVAATLSDPLIKYNTVNQWDGKLPVVSGDSNNIIDLRSLTEDKEPANE